MCLLSVANSDVFVLISWVGRDPQGSVSDVTPCFSSLGSGGQINGEKGDHLSH